MPATRKDWPRVQTVMAAEDTSARKARKQQAARIPEAKASVTDNPDKPATRTGGMPLGGVKRRPSVYADGILIQICDGLSQGLSIKAICEPDTMPHFTEVYREMKKSEEVATAIAQAREAQQDFIADEIIEMADLATPENVNVVKLQIWARQWRAAKLAPKKYGDNQKVEVNHNIKIAEEHAAALLELSRRKREAEGKLIDVTPDPSPIKGARDVIDQQVTKLLPRAEDDEG